MTKLSRQRIFHLLDEQGTSVQLGGSNLQNLDLSQLNLRGADLCRANIQEADVHRSNLQHADLSHSNLQRANLSRSQLSHANLSAADLRKASLYQVDLQDATLQNANLNEANVSNSNLARACMEEASLEQVDLHESNLHKADLQAANLTQANISRSNFQQANLHRANLSAANLQQADLREADLSHACLEGAKLLQANLQGANLSCADIRGADLSEVNLQYADLRGARYDRKTRWPATAFPYASGVIMSEKDELATPVMTILPGKPSPLGPSWDGRGINFALFAEQATYVELCLFASADAPYETVRIAMPEQTGGVWHIYLPDLRPGQVYGYRVHGPYEPEKGLRFNPHKLLIDPYARALTGKINWESAVFAYQLGDELQDLAFDTQDSAPYVPRCIVINEMFDWGDDRPPATPLHKSLIYELHVKGFTQLHPDVPQELRGTYAGLANPCVIDYLLSLGVTAVELLPVHQHIDESFLLDRGLSNYWGYSTLSYFAPEISYSSQQGTPGEVVREFKEMVKALHAAGIEVILDVVYNHSCEGNHLGPTLSLRGIDNMAYYRTVEQDPRYYMDYTGCGNSLNMTHQRTIQLIMDSLRYWITEMHVDGFRFDLAATLLRGEDENGCRSAFLDIIQQDPVISQVKLIAEPWDMGPDGYQIGRFASAWSEWNGKYRDTVRRFWRGDNNMVPDMAFRLSGSSDLYEYGGRPPTASINFITAHDGFTLRDLVSYNEKRNYPNGEENNDGDDHNNSWNCGIEGETGSPTVRALRLRMMRNLMATMLLSQGVPMLLAGDEFARTQWGNNNAYCQDNEISWLNWSFDDYGHAMLEFTREMIKLRQRHPVLRRQRYFRGLPTHGTDIHDIFWLRPDGYEMGDEDWSSEMLRCIGMLLNGQAIEEWDEHGQSVHDDVLFLILNASDQHIRFYIPNAVAGKRWEIVVDTGRMDAERLPTYQSRQMYPLLERSLVLLRQRCDRPGCEG
jgi:glycogen operon protein